MNSNYFGKPTKQRLSFIANIFKKRMHIIKVISKIIVIVLLSSAKCCFLLLEIISIYLRLKDIKYEIFITIMPYESNISKIQLLETQIY